MKNIKVYVYLLVVSLLVLSCNDPRRDNMSPSMLYMANSGERALTIYDVGEPETINVSVIRSGINDVAATATVDVLPDAIAEFNEENRTSYKMLPANCYTFQKVGVSIPANEQYANTPVIVDVEELKKLDDISSYVLPIGLTETSFDMSEKLKVSFMKFEVKPAIVSMSIQGASVVEYNATSTATVIQIPLTIPFKNLWEIKANLTVDETVLAEFNSEYELLCEMMPASAYKITPNPAIFEKGKDRTSFTVTVDQTKLGKSRYVIPIKLSSITSDKAIFPDTDKDLMGIVITGTTTSDRKGWVIDSYSSSQANDGQGPNSVLDGQLTTFWHSQYTGNAAPPSGPAQWMVIDMGKEVNITDIMIAPRSAALGHTNSGYFEVSNDKVNWKNVGKYTVAESHTLQAFPITPSKVRYFKVWVTNRYGQISEISAKTDQ